MEWISSCPSVVNPRLGSSVGLCSPASNFSPCDGTNSTMLRSAPWPATYGMNSSLHLLALSVDKWFSHGLGHLGFSHAAVAVLPWSGEGGCLMITIFFGLNSFNAAS